jgi:hypothetical protein
LNSLPTAGNQRPGFIRQEDIPFDDVLSTKYGALFGTLGTV